MEFQMETIILHKFENVYEEVHVLNPITVLKDLHNRDVDFQILKLQATVFSVSFVTKVFYIHNMGTFIY